MPIGRYSKRGTRKPQKRMKSKIEVSLSFKKKIANEINITNPIVFWIGFILSFWYWQFIIFPVGVILGDMLSHKKEERKE